MWWKNCIMLQFLSALFLGSLDIIVCEMQHFIVPSNDYPCHYESCKTLSHFTENINTNTSLIFTEGHHILSVSIYVSNISKFSMLAMNNCSVNIVCSNHAYLNFSSVGLVHLSNLTFIACDNRVEFVQQFVINLSKFTGGQNRTVGTLLNIVETNAYVDGTNFSNGTGMHSSQLIWNHSDISSGTIGGAIVALKSNLAISNSKFEANSANVGGAIFFGTDSNVMISKCEFTFNHATNCPKGSCLGGALFAKGRSKVIIENSTFENNTSDGDGGAIAIFNVTLLVSHSYILRNTADMGGAVAAFQHSSLVFNASTLCQNIANTSGGAIHLKRGSSKIYSCKISNNKAYEMGGVLFIMVEGFVEIYNQSIISNNTSGYGGVVHATSTVNNIGILEFNTVSNPELNKVMKTVKIIISISNSMFNKNKAILFGGVLSLHSYHSITTVRNSTFCHNNANDRGGVISMSGSENSVSIFSSNFTHNTATIYGGVVSLTHESRIHITNSTFENNFSGIAGGVIDCYSLGNVTVHGSNFSNNAANIGGGVLNIKNGSTFLVKHSQFFNNTDTDLGGIVYAVGGSNITIDACYFIQNSANYGGVLTAKWKVSILVNNSIFHNNRAANNGGTIFTRKICTTTINNCKFICNMAVNDGVTIASDLSILHIIGSNFSSNIAGHDGGVAYTYNNSTIVICRCHLYNNRAENSGGIIYGLKNSSIQLSDSTIEQNSAQNSGGGVHAQKNTTITIETSNFTRNTADYGGGVSVYVQSVAIIKDCNFNENKATVAGGSVAAYESSIISVQASNFALSMANVGGVGIAYCGSTLTFNEGTFRNNTANHGGALYVQGSNVTINYNPFDQNSARHNGGVIYSTTNSFVYINFANFTNNRANNDGGVMILIDNSVVSSDHSVFVNNSAEYSGGVMHLYQSKAIAFNSIFNLSSAGTNGGALVALNSSINLIGSCFVDSTATNVGGAIDVYSRSKVKIKHSNFLRNRVNNSGGGLYIAINSSGYVFNSTFQQNTVMKNGGAISVLSLSNIVITESRFFDNSAKVGAAFAAEQNSLISFDTNSSNKIYNNTATKYGGGVFLKCSKLYFGNINISFNRAKKSGGGLHAVNSSIIFHNYSKVKFYGNQANHGGGVSLTNSKFCNSEMKGAAISSINFTMNRADQGGAIYVHDENAGTVCSNNPYIGIYLQESGCFFQNVTSLHINFFYNSAVSRSSGYNLFGGLLDRCTVISNKSVLNLEPDGIARFKMISNLKSYDTISSRPVRLCICSETMTIECGKQTTSIQVKMNDSFSLYVVAVDQVNNTVAATIKSSFKDPTFNLKESETIRRIGTKCSKLKYHVPFPKSHETYTLIVFPEGPCGNNSISALNITISVINCSCPPGFMQAESETKCECVCDRQYESFHKYITNCDIAHQLVIRRGSFWITYIGNSSDDNISPYFIYPYCPLDYCQPPSEPISINLSLANGSDSQCANNCSGILCGQCLSNHSLSLGSSKCIECPVNWYGLLIGILIAALIAGILLVFALLFLNLTVAIGTLNSIIFYANIVYANRGIYFSQTSLVYASAFISWLNLNIGLDVCFIKGLDFYSKSWLELFFPIYIIVLVIIVIFASSHSTRFSNLLGKKNPVAALATLILLSYTKLLESVIASFSFVNLKYPNGTVVTRWLLDASVQFKEWKNIALICMGIFIFILGLLYTILIFCWQWLLRCPRLMLFKWTRNQKLHSFIDTYHIPYTTKHRYWTGLLLLVRIGVYLISTFTLPIDPRISLFTIVTAICCLLTYKTLFAVRVYKNKLLNAMESFVYLNIAIFAMVTWYTLDDPSNKYKGTTQRVCAYVSVVTIFVLLLLIIIYHIFRYASAKVYTVCQNSDLGKTIKYHLEYNVQDQNSSNTVSYNLLDLIDDPRETEGYTAPPLHLHHQPTVTTSTVSMTDSMISESP